MDTNDAYRMGTRLMDTYLPLHHGWKLRYDQASVRFGCCKYGPKTLTLSRALVELNDEATVRLVILHEIAHALTPGHRHGPKWQAECLRIGGDGKQYYSKAAVTGVDKKWYADCGSCGKRYERTNRPQAGRYACKCGGRYAALTWRDKGAVARTVYAGDKVAAATTAPAPAPVATDAIKWRGIARETGTTVSIVDRKKQGTQGAGESRWACVCETHGRTGHFVTSAEAWKQSAHPLTWCDDCQAGA